ncbi:MAG TPA: Spy/CpxP family protein refolding chaperone [Blastocatellia bacterium]|nr:Spy/CpxP family protein refolding chaperone [Blastocatellia bacterium]
MKKVVTVLLFLAAAAWMAIDASAQLRTNRILLGGVQVRRNNRVAPSQRGINRPLGGPQLGPNRGLNPNQLRRRQLQQRVMQSLGLTQDQRLRIQEIRRNHDDDLIAAGRRLRQARQALDGAIMSEPYDEAVVRRATEALANAQADKVRLDAGVRAQVRGVLTSDQVRLFNQLQRQMLRERREQRLDQEREMGPRGTTTPPESDDVDLLALLFLVP